MHDGVVEALVSKQDNASALYQCGDSDARPEYNNAIQLILICPGTFR